MMSDLTTAEMVERLRLSVVGSDNGAAFDHAVADRLVCEREDLRARIDELEALADRMASEDARRIAELEAENERLRRIAAVNSSLHRDAEEEVDALTGRIEYLEGLGRWLIGLGTQFPHGGDGTPMIGFKHCAHEIPGELWELVSELTVGTS